MMKRRRSDQTHACAIMIILMMFSTYGLGALPILGDDSVMMPVSSNYTEYDLHDPIMINGDEAFTEENGVVGGNGTEDDPYIISGWMINTEELVPWSAAIEIVNASAHFLITDVSIEQGNNDYAFRGIYLRNLTQGSVTACVLESVSYSVSVQSSSNISIVGNDLSSPYENGPYNYRGATISASNNVTFAENICRGMVLNIASSSNISILDNSICRQESDNSLVSVDINIENSERCIVQRNTLWAHNISYIDNGHIALRECTSCTVDDNAMGGRGISILGMELQHYSTHDIGPNNTVRTLPLVVHMNTDGIRIDETDFGQLVILNCTDLRLQDSSFQGLSCNIDIYLSSGIDISDCSFTDSAKALSVLRSSDIRIRHNTFINQSDICIGSCNDCDFSDNDLISSERVSLQVFGSSNCTLENNLFDPQSTREIYIDSSTNLIIRENRLSTGGLRIEGESIDEYISHTIDSSNVIANGKPVLYLKDRHDIDFDMRDYGQLIMGNCTDITAYGLVTSASRAIQIGFSENITVRECKTYGFQAISLDYSDGVTLVENDYM